MTITIPRKLIINDRLYNDMMFLAEYTINMDNESGGFLIKALHGNIGVMGLQKGEDREIDFSVNEGLHEGESYMGTFHAHPLTSTFSTGDIKSYLQDDLEHVMMNTGSDKQINVAIKVPGVTQDISDDTEFDTLELEQDDMPTIADVFKFLYYHGASGEKVLELANVALDTWEVGVQIVDEEVSLEELLTSIGVEGTSHLPSSYGTKKMPMDDTLISYTA